MFLLSWLELILLLLMDFVCLFVVSFGFDGRVAIPWLPGMQNVAVFSYDDLVAVFFGVVCLLMPINKDPE